MTILDRLAASNTKRLEETARMSDAATNTYIGQAVADSDNGSVQIILSDDAITPAWSGEGTTVEVPTTTAVHAGDNVLVQTFGGHVMTSPVVTGVVGRGDELQELAEDAEAVANAVSQHFWTSTTGTDSGAHVTEVTQEEWNDVGGSSYHSGSNSLWNSLGMLFRDGLTNLMAVLTSGVAIYDGLGNAASNIVASFTAAGATIGRLADSHAVFDSSGFHVYFGEANVFDINYQQIITGSVVSDISSIDTAGTSLSFANVTDTQQPGYDQRRMVFGFNDENVNQYNVYALKYGANGAYAAGVSVNGETYEASVEARANDTSSYVTLDAKNIIISQNAESVSGIGFVPSGGSSGQVLAKSSGTNYDVGWITPNVPVASTTITLSNLGSGTKTLYLYRQGNFVVAEFNATTNATANSAISAGTIPTGYRPDRNVYQGGARYTNNSANGTYRWRVASTGVITFWTTSTGTYETPLTLCWYTANSWPSS